MTARSIARHCLFVGVGVVLVSLAASAQSGQAPKAALNVKLGLWEVTSATQMSGTPPMGDMDKLPPEQRAKFEAAMKGMMENVAKPHTVKSCLTREKMDKSMFQDNGSKDCKQTVLTNTSSVYAFKIVCTGREPMSGEFKFEALSPEAVKGSGTMTLDKNQMTSKSTIGAKWIAASCGDVK